MVAGIPSGCALFADEPVVSLVPRSTTEEAEGNGGGWMDGRAGYKLRSLRLRPVGPRSFDRFRVQRDAEELSPSRTGDKDAKRLVFWS
jgi:hypothetical protein